MTQPCQHCGNPSEEPTCLRCQAEQGRISGYPAWSDSSQQPPTGKRHDKHVEEVRQWLAALPDLYAQLAMFALPGSVPQDPDGKRSKTNPAWRSVINLDVLDLTDIREKLGNEYVRDDADLDRRSGERRQGTLPTLTGWVRLVDEQLEHTDGYVTPWIRQACCAACTLENARGRADVIGCCPGSLRPHPWEDRTIVGECGYLLKHLDWISEQQWFDGELHPDVRKMRADVRSAIGERDRHVDRFVCPACGNEAVLVAGGWLACTETTEHDTSVRDLERQYRRKPPRPTKDICTEFGITPERLWQWKARGIKVGTRNVKIVPARTEGRVHWWLPWDVFSMLNPDLRAAIDMRDTAEVG